jgi:hypothetical protein
VQYFLPFAQTHQPLACQLQYQTHQLLNALEIQGKTPENAMLTCLGAGAAGIATLDLLCESFRSKP